MLLVGMRGGSTLVYAFYRHFSMYYWITPLKYLFILILCIF